MANSLECRSPFLNHKIVEFAVSLRSDWKMNGFKKKDFLKKSQSDILPKKILNAKKKGFNSPVSIWLNNSLNKIAKELTLDSEITNLIKKNTSKSYGKNMKIRKSIIASGYLLNLFIKMDINSREKELTMVTNLYLHSTRKNQLWIQLKMLNYYLKI